MTTRSRTVTLSEVRAKLAGEDTRNVCRTLADVRRKAREGGAVGVVLAVAYPDGRIVTTQTYAGGGKAWTQMVAGAAMLTRALTDDLEDA